MGADISPAREMATPQQPLSDVLSNVLRAHLLLELTPVDDHRLAIRFSHALRTSSWTAFDLGGVNLGKAHLRVVVCNDFPETIQVSLKE